MKKMTPEELEQFIHRELRGLPVRPAPATLEARVLAAIEHRATIAWYHKSWSYWPAPVRALFLALATGFAGVAIGAFYLFIHGAEPALIWQQLGSRFELLSGLYRFAAWTVDFVSRLIGNVPSLWLYGSLAFIATLYATLIGLGATAYRFLYRRHQ